MLNIIQKAFQPNKQLCNRIFYMNANQIQNDVISHKHNITALQRSYFCTHVVDLQQTSHVKLAYETRVWIGCQLKNTLSILVQLCTSNGMLPKTAMHVSGFFYLLYFSKHDQNNTPSVRTLSKYINTSRRTHIQARLHVPHTSSVNMPVAAPSHVSAQQNVSHSECV